MEYGTRGMRQGWQSSRQLKPEHQVLHYQDQLASMTPVGWHVGQQPRIVRRRAIRLAVTLTFLRLAQGI